MLNEGQKLPGFEILDQDSKTQTFLSLVGKSGLILYAYPKDNTPGCTIEALDFRNKLNEFKKMGYHVAGISPDSPGSHCKFIDKNGLTFTLLSDPERKMMTLLGAYGEKKNYGKIVQGVIRSTFVFDSAGVLIKAYRNIKAKGHVERVLKDLLEE
jgi:peroxiredoxin Q/BCP